MGGLVSACSIFRYSGCHPIKRALLSDGVASCGRTDRSEQHSKRGEKKSHRRISLPNAGANCILLVKSWEYGLHLIPECPTATQSSSNKISHIFLIRLTTLLI